MIYIEIINLPNYCMNAMVLLVLMELSCINCMKFFY